MPRREIYIISMAEDTVKKKSIILSFRAHSLEPIESVMKMKRRYPFALVLSAVLYGCREGCLFGMGGVGFLIMGSFLSFQPLPIIAGLFLLCFYLYLCVRPLGVLRKAAEQAGKAQWEETQENARRRGNRALYKRVMLALEDAAQQEEETGDQSDG